MQDVLRMASRASAAISSAPLPLHALAIPVMIVEDGRVAVLRCSAVGNAISIFAMVVGAPEALSHLLYNNRRAVLVTESTQSKAVLLWKRSRHLCTKSIMWPPQPRPPDDGAAAEALVPHGKSGSWASITVTSRQCPKRLSTTCSPCPTTSGLQLRRISGRRTLSGVAEAGVGSGRLQQCLLLHPRNHTAAPTAAS